MIDLTETRNLREAIAAHEGCQRCRLAACDNAEHAYRTALPEQIADEWMSADYSAAKRLADYLPATRLDDLRIALASAAGHGMTAIENARQERSA